MAEITPTSIQDNKVYNFFFCPEKMHGAAKAASIITLIALSVLTGFVYLAFFGYFNHLAQRVQKDPETPPAIQEIAKQALNPSSSDSKPVGKPALNENSAEEEISSEEFELPADELSRSFLTDSLDFAEIYETHACMAVNDLLEKYFQERDNFNLNNNNNNNNNNQAIPDVDSESLLDQDAMTPSYFNATISQLNKDIQEESEVDTIIRTACALIVNPSCAKNPENISPALKNLQPAERSYIFYRLLNEYNMEKFNKNLKAILQNNPIHKFSEKVTAPGDGNCFLWSCVITESILARIDAGQMVSYESFVKKNKPMLKNKQEQLRKAIVAIFTERQKDPSFRQIFVSYLLNNPAFQEIVPSSEIARAQMWMDADPSPQIVNGYLKMLSSNGSWNGEFEAELASLYFKRPIILLSFRGQILVSKAIAGGQFFDNGKAPLFLLHNGGHYDALIPNH